ncbi:SAM-dependent methyltransferase [Mycolicibacterium sp. XJ879]
MSTPDAKTHWEEHYGERNRVWSGRANARLVEVAESLKPGRALDLGCGEGGDALWLAERGWRVVGVDISETALQRAVADAEERGVSDRVEFRQADLPEQFPDGTFDLVSAQFLHSTLPLDRPRIFRRAADAIRPEGLLLIVDHGGPPPWASKLHHHHDFPSAKEVFASLNLPEAQWESLRVESAEREASGPSGETGTLVDNIILLRRRASDA